jgi:hypothetical protein
MASVSPRHIVALLLILSVAMDAHRAFAQQNETRIALLIGNASYPDAEAPLNDETPLGGPSVMLVQDQPRC